MANLNKCMLMGNLTKDPELRVTPKGTAICQFSIAINRKYKDAAGADCEEVTYVDIEAWGKTGENVAKYMTKGHPIFVEGRLRLDVWEDKTTKEKRSRMKVVCDNVQFLGTRDNNGGQSAPANDTPQGGRYPTRQPAPARPAAHASQEDLDQDVPF